MFSILHIEPGGREHLVQSHRVECEPAMEINGNRHKVWYDKPDGHTACFDSGSVYVMNDSGKTVAKYFWSYGPVEAETDTPMPPEYPPAQSGGYAL